MAFVSDKDQEFNVGDESFSIAKDEAILTEYSHKYTLEGFAAMAEKAGFSVERVWMDEDRLFSVQLLTRVG